ncbi:NAD-dependent epimerase/dehydratase family protein [Leptobacterium sp. I13]|uniref:NAD-dependent epimerase/dehydratase family protein n=1 Tax=Leptobacterium meishanense TaxID=3128904 RepID=UPI0030EBD3FC
MVLVTGGTGLVGAHLLYKLTADGQYVRAIHRKDSDLNTVKLIFAFFTEDVEKLFSKIEWVEADINDLPKLTKAFKNITYVYHTAALISFDPKDYFKMRKVNIEGTSNIVNLCIANNIKKLCYTSSIAALGKTLDKKPITEKTPWNPEAKNNAYAISKHGAEMEVWRASQEGIDVVIVNPGIILGAGSWNKGSGKIFKRIHNGMKFYTTGITGFVDVEDVVIAMVTLMKSAIKNDRFILVSENWSFKKLFTTIAEKFGKVPPYKKAPFFILYVLCYIDWLKSFFTGSKRTFTKASVHAAFRSNYYSSEKIKKAIEFDFKPLSKTIEIICSRY